MYKLMSHQPQPLQHPLKKRQSGTPRKHAAPNVTTGPLPLSLLSVAKGRASNAAVAAVVAASTPTADGPSSALVKRLLTKPFMKAAENPKARFVGAKSQMVGSDHKLVTAHTFAKGSTTIRLELKDRTLDIIAQDSKPKAT
mmetsp:Transcript_42485/g.98452  ORF Transcript_42485/g.98452 Transcript_42485/m.98452 type:complete len:141 (+) Transcript_42485:360-782(+)